MAMCLKARKLNSHSGRAASEIRKVCSSLHVHPNDVGKVPVGHTGIGSNFSMKQRNEDNYLEVLIGKDINRSLVFAERLSIPHVLQQVRFA